jgi:DNA-binding transcriptional ArsR family regulator
MTCTNPRLAAAQALDRALDAEFLDALGHPVRVGLIRTLVLTGAADIATLASQFPQDRSVISRHLSVLERAGLAVARRKGRAVVYDLDGPGLIARLGRVQAAAEGLAAICCPPNEPEPENDPAR